MSGPLSARLAAHAKAVWLALPHDDRAELEQLGAHIVMAAPGELPPGRLGDCAANGEIRLSPDLPDDRARFVLAHELAHLLNLDHTLVAASPHLRGAVEVTASLQAELWGFS